MTELLCLKWNNHSLAFNKLLSYLYLNDVYSDATLVCHGKFYPIHRFVLSNCSEYFLEIFERSIRIKCKHPFIFIQDIQPEQMEALLNYMYKGEVSVPSENLPEFLKAAEAIKMKGIAVPDDNDQSIISEPESSKEKRTSDSPSPTPKRSKSDTNEIEAVNTIKETDELQSIFSGNSEFLQDNDVKPESINSGEPDLNNSTEMSFYYERSSMKDEQLEAYNNYNNSFNPEHSNMGQSSSWDDCSRENMNNDSSQSMSGMCDANMADNKAELEWDAAEIFQRATTCQTMSKHGPVTIYSCPNCPFQCKSKFNLKRHIVIKHAKNKPFKCHYCPYECASEDSLRTHTRKHTGEKPFICPHCPYRATQNVHLQTHLKTHTGEKPYQCNICPFKSSQKYNLNFHMKKHQTEEDNNVS